MAHDVPGTLFATTQIQTAHARYQQWSSYFCTVLQNGSDPVLTGDEHPSVVILNGLRLEDDQ